MKLLSAVCLCLVLAAAGCQRHAQTGTVIARVGDAVLTLEDARSSIDTSRIPLERQLPRYVASWVNSELLFQEARRMGLDNADAFQRRRDDAVRSLLVGDLLQQQVYSDTTGISEEQLRAYYEQHRAEFIAREDMMKLNMAAFERRDQASAFAAALARGATWETAARSRKDSTVTESSVSMKLGQSYSQQTIFPAELWKVATTLRVNEVSYPVKTDAGYFLLQPLAIVQKGQQADYDMCRSEVLQRSTIEHRRALYDTLLGTLRHRYTVEVMVSPAELTDTTQVRYDD